MKPESPVKTDMTKPMGDRKVARMAFECKGNGSPFPTFCGRNSAFPNRRGKARWTGTPSSLLQLTLQRLDLFGQRHILGDQRLDLAHGMQHRGVVAPTEAAADLGK